MLVEFLFELKNSIDRHGIRWGVVFALYAVFRKEKRNYRLDKRDREHNIYFQAILENQVKIMDGLGVEPCANTSTLITQLSAKKQEDGYMSLWMEKLRARYAARKGTWSYTNWNTGRQTKMKMYLQKLGRTKFQAFLITTILNIGTLIAMWTGNVNVEGDLKTWMPGISLIIQVLAGYIYSWAQGKVDTVIAQNGGPTNEPAQPTITIDNNR